MGINVAVKKILFEARHTKPRKKPTSKAFGVLSLFFLAECCPVRQLNTVLTFCILSLSRKINKLLKGGK
jgi:hypothetical protein